MEHHFDMELDGLETKAADHGQPRRDGRQPRRRARWSSATTTSRVAGQGRTTTCIDRFEMEIDELAIQLLSKAPLASDLRLVTVAMKISQNLERVGDEAAKIAKRARDLSQEPPLKLNLDLPAHGQAGAGDAQGMRWMPS